MEGKIPFTSQSKEMIHLFLCYQKNYPSLQDRVIVLLHASVARDVLPADPEMRILFAEARLSPPTILAQIIQNHLNPNVVYCEGWRETAFKYVNEVSSDGAQTSPSDACGSDCEGYLSLHHRQFDRFAHYRYRELCGLRNRTRGKR